VEPFAAAVGSHGELERAIDAALRSPGGAAPAPTLEIDFDADASPWYTLCEVRGPDRPGLLHAVTVGFATMGVTVHSARIETIGGVAIDRFELSDTAGRKLDAKTQRAVRDAVWSGSAGDGSARGRRRLRRRERAAVGGG
jgi:[protein-PII] uridylyltransferase